LGPFNYALYAASDGACFCQTECLSRGAKAENTPCGDVARHYNFWRHVTRWNPESKVHGEEWNLTVAQDDARIHELTMNDEL
jgi:hypothetical protein